MRDDREILRHRLLSLIQQELSALDERIALLIKNYESRINQLDSLSDYSPANLRSVRNRYPEINQLLIFNPQGERIFPDRSVVSTEEQEFLKRSQPFLESIENYKTSQSNRAQKKVFLSEDRDDSAQSRPLEYKEAKTAGDVEVKQKMESNVPGATSPAMAPSTSFSAPQQLRKKSMNQRVQTADSNLAQTDIEASRGWSVWSWEKRINLIYWYKNREGYLIAAEVPRSRLIADISTLSLGAAYDAGREPYAQQNRQATTSSLKPTPPVPDFQIQLSDTHRHILYQWGSYHRRPQQKPLASVSLSWPLNTWKLGYFSKDLGAGSALNYAPLALGMVSVMLALIGLGYYFYRESNRELTTARQRVSFVNQVSHELKTPLTNIRMYAEMLEDQLEDHEPDAQGKIKVIVSETQRLSRLINNVLSFARHQRNKLTLHRSMHCVDDIILNVMHQFKPSLERHQFQISLNLSCLAPVHIDPDVCEQILHNLVSNVEKYALAGRHLSITSEITNGQARIGVHDQGPGIPKFAAKKIFEPFYRLSHRLTEGVSGTGIGLSIARDLARLHGGDLVLEASAEGSRFVLTLNIR